MYDIEFECVEDTRLLETCDQYMALDQVGDNVPREAVRYAPPLVGVRLKQVRVHVNGATFQSGAEWTTRCTPCKLVTAQAFRI
jgi:hypothetical protein